ncbi:T-complex protein 1 subunit delta [Nymphaea thermarum]|nr:T-complex protein 1 subunit delta [Nymphaea thermarum]
MRLRLAPKPSQCELDVVSLTRLYLSISDMHPTHVKLESDSVNARFHFFNPDASPFASCPPSPLPSLPRHHQQGHHCLTNHQEAWGNRQQRQAALPVTLSNHDPHSGGLILDHKASHATGGPTRMENPKIKISPPKNDIEHSIVISDYTQWIGFPNNL